MLDRICTADHIREPIIDWYYFIVAWSACYSNKRREFAMSGFMETNVDLQSVV